VEAFTRTWTFAVPNSVTSSASEPHGSAASGKGANKVPHGQRNCGIYKGYKYVYTTVLGVVQKRATEDYLTFYPDGFIYHVLPFHGWTGLDRSQVLRTNPEVSGFYEIAGDRLTLALDRGRYRFTGHARRLGH
jgi:hypothetical protein